MRPLTLLAVGTVGAVVLLALSETPRAPRLPPAPPPPKPPRPPTGPPGPPVRGPFSFSAASLGHLEGVHPEIAAVAHRGLELSPTDFAVVDGMRSVAEQERKVREGLSNCSPLQGCQAKHVLGRALDIAPLIDGQVELRDRAPFRQLAPHLKRAAAELGVPVKWLGDDPGELGDFFHWELGPGVGAPSTDGYRRARQSEVTPYIEAHAIAALRHPLGDVRGPFVDEQGRLFKVRLEPHSNAPKGASVFLRELVA